MDLFKEINKVRNSELRAILFEILNRLRNIEQAIYFVSQGKDVKELIEYRPE